jgi:hypothetical protein
VKEIPAFGHFLSDYVNLDDTRLSLLDKSFEAIKRFIKKSDYGAKVSLFYKQGSWAQKTIIRPVGNKEFDADLIAFVDPMDDWSARDYLDKLYEEFASDGTYSDKVKRYSHCVTIFYAGLRRMDIAVCVVGRVVEGAVEVCNRDDDAFETSNPHDYTKWLKARNDWTRRNQLKKVTRLIKYIRDYKKTFTCPSFLMTTLLGDRIITADRQSDDFADTPTALKTILGRLDDWLQLYPLRPVVLNPSLPSEDQAESLPEDRYNGFRDAIHRYRSWVDAAYGEVDAEKSLAAWQRVFGDDFKRTIAAKKSETAAVEAFDASAPDDVDVARLHGIDAVPEQVKAPTWRSRPDWPGAALLVPKMVIVKARLAQRRRGRLILPVASGQPVEPGQWIEFTASVQGEVDMSGYTSHWRVTNTGPQAEADGQLRGSFVPEDGAMTCWERLEYRGVHMVEAFIVRKADARLVGQSAPFYVVIE